MENVICIVNIDGCLTIGNRYQVKGKITYGKVLYYSLYNDKGSRKQYNSSNFITLEDFIYNRKLKINRIINYDK